MTIADWEWMFEIFSKVEGCKYSLSIPYQGFFETGDLSAGFGTSAYWSLGADGKTVRFGGTSDAFYQYLQKMREWYSKGYLDPKFDEHASDSFYAIDDSTVRQGKVGLWYGMSSQLGNRLQLDNQPLTAGIQVWGAAQPVLNTDITPTVMYQSSLEGVNYIVTDKAKNKNIDKLFKALDYLYTAEGSVMKSFGLNKEQYQETENALMKREGLTDGAYIIVDGKYINVDKVINDGGMLASAVIGDKIVGIGEMEKRGNNYTATKNNSLDQWIQYEATGTIQVSILNQKTEDENKTYASNQNKIRDYMAIETPKFINGQKELNETNWKVYKAVLVSYGCDQNTQILQGIMNRL